MRNLSKEDLPDFQNWLRTKVVVTCPKCMGEFRLPDSVVKFAEDEGTSTEARFGLTQAR